MKATKITTAVAFAAVLTAFAATPAASAAPTRARGAGELRDLQLATSQPTDHATAQVVAVESGGSTTIVLKVQGLDHDAAGETLGAHVHVGQCVEGNGAAAGAHYNSTGTPPTTINESTEVWLDFVVGANGTGSASATVPFVIPPGGAGALVIHADHTNESGAAGPRWACLPVQF